MSTNIIKFTVGEEVTTRSLSDNDYVFRFLVEKRTEKFVTLRYHNELHRVGIKVRDGREYCYPLGSYSMAGAVLATGMTCPRCECVMYPNRLALSRLDNKTKVCPDCGMQEALEQWQNGEVKEWRREHRV